MGDTGNASGGRPTPFFGTALEALKIIAWGKCDDGSIILEVKCQSPTVADDLPKTIADTEHREYQKWGFDPARSAAVYYAVPLTPTDSSHAE